MNTRKLLLLLFLIATTTTQAQYFGDRCLGTWEGMMHLYSKGVLRDSVAVRLTVNKLDAQAWSWKTEYLSPDRPMTKDYVLRLPDPNKNIYVTDEGDGLMLTDYLYGNKLYSVFETQGVFLTSSYEWVNGALIFEVTSGKKEPAKHPEVITYSTDNLQRVVFRKKH